MHLKTTLQATVFFEENDPEFLKTPTSERQHFSQTTAGRCYAANDAAQPRFL